MRKYTALIPLKIEEICNTFPEQEFGIVLYEMFRAYFPGKACIMKSELLNIRNEETYKVLCRVQQQLIGDQDDPPVIDNKQETTSNYVRDKKKKERS